MMTWIAVNGLLWGLIAVLAIATLRHGRAPFNKSLRDGTIEFMRLVPRIGIGMIGSGYLAEVMPQDQVALWLGPNSGGLGLLLATLAGALTPGGPVVGFAIGATALKGGAGTAQVVSYVVAWCLFSFHRIVLFEVPAMPPRIVWLRVAVSLPFPLFAGAAALLLGRP